MSCPLLDSGINPLRNFLLTAILLTILWEHIVRCYTSSYSMLFKMLCGIYMAAVGA